MEYIEEASLRFLQQYAPQQGEEFATTMTQLKRDVSAKVEYIGDTSDSTDGVATIIII